MKTYLFLYGLVVALLLSAPLFAQPEPKPEPKGKKEAWIVVQVTKEKYEVMEADDLKEFAKKAEADYKSALDDWTKARAAAKKEKREFTEPKPEKPLAKKAAGPFKTEEEARNAMAKLQSKGKKKDRPKEPDEG